MRRSRTAAVAFVAVPAALTAVLAFRSGGAFPGATGLAAAQVAFGLALWLGLAPAPTATWTRGVLIGVVLFALLGLWMWLSKSWSLAPWRADAELSRLTLYAGVFLLGACAGGSAKRLRVLLWTLATVCVGICICALIARTLPSVISDPQAIHPDRLSYPLSYWNGLGMVAVLGIVLCGHLACEVRGPRIARVLGAASVPLLTAALYYTFSRGAAWAALMGVGAYVIVARPRGILSGAIATVPTTLVTVLVINPADVLTAVPLTPAGVSAGHRIALELGLLALAAGALRALALPLDRRIVGITIPPLSRRLAIALGTVAVVSVSGAGVALGVTDLAERKYDEFVHVDSLPGGGLSRLLSASNNGRLDHWRASLEDFKTHEVHGTGSGTYPSTWLRNRRSDFIVRDAHSLYIEVLGELGIVGLVLFVALIGLMLAGLARRVRGPDGATAAALFAAAVAWALHAGVDWDWEMPAVSLWLFAAAGAALASRRRATTPDGEASSARGLSTPLRAVGVAVCLALAVLPARLAIAEGHASDAVHALHDQDCARALPAARAALKPIDHPGPHLVIATCRSDEPLAALVDVRAALRLDPADANLWYTQAVLLALAGKPAEASARRALALDPRGVLSNRAAERFSGLTDPGALRRAAATAVLPSPAP